MSPVVLRPLQEVVDLLVVAVHRVILPTLIVIAGQGTAAPVLPDYFILVCSITVLLASTEFPA